MHDFKLFSYFFALFLIFLDINAISNQIKIWKQYKTQQ
jgi:hypothetical protein